MKLIMILLSILSVGAAHADDNVLFSVIPSYAQTIDAINAVSAAAKNRKWTVNDYKDKKLRIELDHHSYKAVLDFSFTENEIYYSDLTTYYKRSIDDNPFSNAKAPWEASSVPANWIKNLRNDVNAHFNSSVCVGNRDNTEIKLERLKSLYDKKLITEEEYTHKKAMILSEF